MRPGEIATFHDQVGYWLSAETFEVAAERGSTVAGIVANPFLDRNYITERFRMVVTTDAAGGTWSYEEHTTLRIPDRPDAFDHVDRQRLKLAAAPTPNPLALASLPTAGGPAERDDPAGLASS